MVSIWPSAAVLLIVRLEQVIEDLATLRLWIVNQQA
jgi:hypothetical protein